MRDEQTDKPEIERAEEYEDQQDRLTEVGDEVPEADALEQHETLTPDPRPERVDVDREANEADVLEQAEPVGDDGDAWE